MSRAETTTRPQVKVTRSFVTENGTAAITCPTCGLVKHTPVGAYSGRKQAIKVRCRCRTTFVTQLEFRQSHRKKTDLQGMYRILSAEGGSGRAAIKDLSREGIGFMVSGTHKVRVGHNILINFTLDDRKQTTLQKTARVKSVSENRIGCQFKKDQAFEKDLGFYLRA